MKTYYEFRYSKKKEFLLIFSELFFLIFELLKNFYFTSIFKKKLNKFFLKKSKIIIIANGPCLKADLLKINSNTQLFSVNAFPSTVYFKKFKPKYLCWIDSMFWLDFNSLDKNVLKIVQKTYEKLDQADWKIYLFAPIDAKNIILSRIKNKNIIFVDIPYMRFDFESSIYLNFLSFLNVPPPRANVAITAIYIAILSGIKNIDLIGADMNRIHSINVDQKNNQGFMHYVHFSHSKKKINLKDKLINRKPKSIYIKLIREASVFKWFAYVSIMAKNNQIKLKNKSSNSLIDSIER